MHLAGQTEADLSAWAASRGATAGSARVVARALLAGLAGRPVREPPSRRLLTEARSSFETDLPAAEAARDADGTVRFSVRLQDGNLVETVAIHQAAPERRITVSTVGIVPRMDELYARSRVNLAVSLHAVDPAARRALLPVARRWELGELRAAIARAPRTVLLQWTLIAGVNDSDRETDALADFARGLDVRVNLIPLNPGPDPDQHAPSLARCRAFQRRLACRGVRALLRLPHGQSVGGACGQLAGSLRTQAQG